MRTIFLKTIVWVGCMVIGASGVIAADEEASVTLGRHHVVRESIHLKHVTVWPVYSTHPIAKLSEYQTLKQAQDAKTGIVREIGAASSNSEQHQASQNQSEVSAVQQDHRPIREQSQGIRQEGQQHAGQQTGQEAQLQNVPQITAIYDIDPSISATEQGNQPNLVLQNVEQSNSHAQVGKLVIENKGSIAILVLAGTVVKGGKQDRLIGQDFIVPAKATVPVDAYCVEHGRWSQQRSGKDTAGVFEDTQVLANFKTRMSGQYAKSQQDVWNSVAQANSSAGKSPQSGTLMATIEDASKESRALRTEIEKTMEQALSSDSAKEAVGLAYAIDGKVREMRVFAHPDLFRTYAHQIISTIAIEADLARQEALKQNKTLAQEAMDARVMQARMKEMQKAKEEEVKTAAQNTNYYRKSEKAASARAEDNLINEKDGDKTVTEVYSFY